MREADPNERANYAMAIVVLPWHPRYLLRAFRDDFASHPPCETLRAGRSAARNASGLVFALAPDEWLLLPEDGATHPAPDQTRPDVALIDVSSAQLVVRLEGDRALDMLMSGCGVDLDSQRFRIDDFAQTRLGPFAVLIHRAGETAYNIHIERSLVDSLRGWLEASASALNLAEGAS
ncbi:MAG: sarcosine oxidase subunit gamma family protein [Ideonella sp.]